MKYLFMGLIRLYQMTFSKTLAALLPLSLLPVLTMATKPSESTGRSRVAGWPSSAWPAANPLTPVAMILYPDSVMAILQGGLDLTQRSRMLGAVFVLLLLGMVLSACGSSPVAQNWPGLTLAGDTLYVISGITAAGLYAGCRNRRPKGTFVPQARTRASSIGARSRWADGMAYRRLCRARRPGPLGCMPLIPETGPGAVERPCREPDHAGAGLC